MGQHHQLGLIGCGASQAVVAGEPIDKASGVTVDDLAGRFSVRTSSPGGRQVGERRQQIVASWNSEVVSSRSTRALLSAAASRLVRSVGEVPR